MSWTKPSTGGGGSFTVRGRAPRPDDGLEGEVWLQMPSAAPAVVPAAGGWEQGNIASATGENVTRSNRARTIADFEFPDRPLLLEWGSIPSAAVVLFFYSSDRAYLGTTSWLESRSEIVTPPSGTVFARAIIARQPRTSAEIEVQLPDDVNTLVIDFLEPSA